LADLGGMAGRRTEPAYAAAHALVHPHLAGFDALFEGAHLPGTPDHEVAASSGLLALGVADLVPKVFFDGRSDANGGRGNRIESKQRPLDSTPPTKSSPC